MVANMATYEEYMNAARNADAAGDEAAARQLVQAAQKVKGDGGLRLGSLRENIIGDGQVDTVGEYVGEAIQSAGAGALRGVRGLLELPELAGRAAVRGYQELTGAEDKTPVLDTATGRAVTRGYGGLAGAVGADPSGIEYRSPTTVGQYAGTVGEFLPAAIGGGASAARTAVLAGLGSEAAGQATEGTALEPVARIVGAFATPAAVSKIANKTIRRSIQRPSVESLRDAKNVAYKAVDDSGVKFAANEVDDLITKAKSSVDDFNYVPDVDLQTKAALSTIQAQAGKELTIGQLDKLRQGLYKRYSRAPQEQGIRAIIDDIDDLIEAKAPANSLMSTAREANKRYKKSELLDEAFKRAERNTAASGSGGNVVNNYRAAVKNILNSKRDSKYFLDGELEVMEQFVKGNLSENTMRLIGKLSPSGNGLMQALNIGAIAYNPSMVAVTGAGMAAKAGAERSAIKSVEAIKDMIATGVSPEKRKLITDREIRILLGLEAGQEQ